MNKELALPASQIAELKRVAALRKKQPRPKPRVIIVGQVADELVPYVNQALQTVSKTDLINLALASYFEVQVYESVGQ